MQPEFKKINPFKRVPAISDNGFTLAESHAILRLHLNHVYPNRYLCETKKVKDSWYPKDPI